MRALRLTSLSALLTTAVAAGCSLVNSLDDVKPADDGQFTSVTRPDAAGVTVEETGPPPTTVDASETSTTGEAFSPLVVGGEVASDGGVLEPVLTVLDSKSGREVSTRERMWVAGIAHDAPRDLWYIFEAATHFIANTTEDVKLHIRRLDTTTGAWTELSAVAVGPLVYYDAIGVTSERVSIVAHPASGSAFRLVTINTTNPASPVVATPITLPQNPRGMVATRSLSGTGGYLSFYNPGVPPATPPSDAGTEDAGPQPTPECEGPQGNMVCVVRARQYFLPNGTDVPVAQGSHTYGRMAQTGQPGFGSIVCNAGPDDVTLLPLADGVHALYTRPYLQPATSQLPLRTFTMSTEATAPTVLRKAAIDNARRLVFMVEANADTNLHAISLDPSVLVQRVSIRHSGQSVYYDPASETVFAPFNQGEGYTFSPFLVRGGPSSFNLQERTATTPDAPWTAPPDLRPTILGIREPLDLCQ
ncbi:MAG: hypothetical protein KIT84_28500 [Labilithrix sp.]|nr:hypothetical protein [Labilithrix sp.]MCW5815000.1 hypothetical protein [Labilithrix sp.]